MRLYGGQCCEVLVYVSKAPEMEIKAGDYRGSVKINRLMVSALAISSKAQHEHAEQDTQL